MAKDEADEVGPRGTVRDIAAPPDEAALARRVNRARTTLIEGNRALIRATDEQELLDAICRIAVGLAGYSLAWVGFAEDDERKTVRPVARYGEATTYLEEISVTWGDDALGRGPTGKAIQTGRVSMARDLAVEPGFETWRVIAARHHLASSIALPLCEDEVAFGALMVYAPEPDAFDDPETEILVELAKNLAFAFRRCASDRSAIGSSLPSSRWPSRSSSPTVTRGSPTSILPSSG
jgi:GAF domain-containing protein